MPVLSSSPEYILPKHLPCVSQPVTASKISYIWKSMTHSDRFWLFHIENFMLKNVFFPEEALCQLELSN